MKNGRIRTVLAAMAAFGAAAAAFGAVGSAGVAPAKAELVFAPVVQNGGNSAADTVDTDVVFNARFTEDFTVDGDVSKPVWTKAEKIPEFVGRSRPDVSAVRSDVRFLYSKTSLYVGATFWQDMAKQRCKWNQRDHTGIFGDDNVEAFLVLKNGLSRDCYHYCINPLGTILDMKGQRIAYWTRGMTVKTRRFDDRWTLEWRIPFEGIPMDRPVSGDFVAFRLCRNLNTPRYVAQIPSVKSGGYEQLRYFAKLNFLEPEGADTKTFAEEKAYRASALKARLDAKESAFRRRFAGIRGAAAVLAGSKHPLVAQALAGLAQMEKSLAGGFDPATAAGFEDFASRYAYAVWQTDVWGRGSPDELPPVPEPGGAAVPPMPKQILFEQAGNEREAVCLAFTGLLCGNRLDLRLVPEGVGKDGVVISPDAFEVYCAPFVGIENEVWTYPLVRAPGNIVTVTPGETVRVWIVFNSRGVKTGRYESRLLVKNAYPHPIAPRSIAIGAKVWNFDLPETHDWPIRSFFWGPFDYRMDEVQCLELMHRSHVTHAWTQQFRYKYGMYGDRGHYTRPACGRGKLVPGHDFEDEYALNGNEAFLRRAKDLGMRFVIGWGVPTSRAWYDAVIPRFEKMGFTKDDFVFHGMLRDEFSLADIPTERAGRDAIADIMAKYTFGATYLATPPPTGAAFEDVRAAKLPEQFRLWWLISGFAFDKERNGGPMIDYLREKGCQVWSYRCNTFMHGRGQTPGYYRFHAWKAYMRGLDGFAFWTVHSPKGLDGWDSSDGYDDGTTWRGLDRQVVTTTALEQIREGLEDVAYMNLLEKALKAEKAKGREHADCERLLADRESVIRSNDHRRVDIWRLAAGRAIDAISAGNPR